MSIKYCIVLFLLNLEGEICEINASQEFWMHREFAVWNHILFIHATLLYHDVAFGYALEVFFPHFLMVLSSWNL